MKYPFRKLCAGLLAVLLAGFWLPVRAEHVTVRIPTSIHHMDIPDMPEPLILTTYAQNNGKLAYLDGDYTIYFEDEVDYAAVDWVNELEEVVVRANGTAVTNKEGHSYQQNGVLVRRDGISMSYTNSGVPKAMWISTDVDYFSTGQEGAWSSVYWRCVDIRTSWGDLEPTWFVSNVTTSYPIGSAIRSVSVDYYNNKGNTVCGYTITYAADDMAVYSVRYDKTDKPVRLYYHDGNRTLEYVIVDSKWVWRDVLTEKIIMLKKLRPMESFVSPRKR